MTDKENEERDKNLSELADDPAHPFDQTNGLVDGLDGDADTPEEVDKRTGNDEDAAILAAPSPGSQMIPGGALPVEPVDADEDDDEDPDADVDPDAGDPHPSRD